MAKISLNVKEQNRKQTLFSQSPNLTYKTHMYTHTYCPLLNKKQLNPALKIEDQLVYIAEKPRGKSGQT